MNNNESLKLAEYRFRERDHNLPELIQEYHQCFQLWYDIEKVRSKGDFSSGFAKEYFGQDMLIQDLSPDQMRDLDARTIDSETILKHFYPIQDSLQLALRRTQYFRYCRSCHEPVDWFKARNELIDEEQHNLFDRMQSIKEEALGQDRIEYNLWAMGVPYSLATGMLSDNNNDHLPTLKYFLENCLRRGDTEYSNELIERIFPNESVNILLEQMIAEGKTDSFLFVNVCALASYNDLSDSARYWFKSQLEGLVSINQPQHAHLRHKNDTQGVGAVPCMEVGAYILGEALALTVGRIPEHGLALKSFSTHYSTEKLPRGSLAEVNYYDRWHLVVPAAYIVGSDEMEGNKGILVPGLIYMTTKNTFHGEKNGNFYVRQSGVNEVASIAFDRITKYLQTGET